MKGLFSLFRKRRKKKQLDELPSQLSPNVAVEAQSPPIASSVAVPNTPTSFGDSSEDSSSDKSVVFSDMTFSYKKLAKATDEFSSLLGQGGFGHVYKGVLKDGKEVAVKKLKSGSGQGEREFQAELDTISGVQHKHLVSLVGYCISGDERLLVYEYVPNKTLEFHLHGVPKIIHRDIKASNILLDDNFEAKVADFGLAKFNYDSNTHVSTRIMGTFGYVAPEYAATGKLSEKSDVFSFGVVLLELITGHRPINIVEWAKPLLRDALETGNFGRLVDPELKEYNAAEMAQMVACAAACVHCPAGERPQMSQIVQALEGNPFNWTLPPSSAFSGSSDYEQDDEILKKFQKLAFESLGLSSSGFAALASDSDAPPLSISSMEHQSESQDTGSGNTINDDEDFRDIPIL